MVALATQPPLGMGVVFTDGSRLDNGQAGAGYSILIPGWPKELHADPLGVCDNNEAELEAICRSLRRITHRHKEGWRGTAILFSDSAGCLGYLMRGWRIAVRQGLARETRRLYHRVSNLCRFRMYWIRGHAGVPGNEEVDGLAKKGSGKRGAR